MNFKIQYGKKIHKLPSGLTSFDELLFSIRSIFAGKLPDMYTLRYEDTEGEWIQLETKDDFTTAVTFLREINQTSLKIKLIRALKPTLDLYDIPEMPQSMTESRIGSLFANQPDLNVSTIQKEVEVAPAVIAEQASKSDEPEIIESSVPLENEQKIDEHVEVIVSKPQEAAESVIVDAVVAEAVIQKPDFIPQSMPVVAKLVEKQPEPLVEKQRDVDFFKNSFTEAEHPKQPAVVDVSVKELIDDRFNPSNLENLRAFVEEIVEEKLRQILSNYNLVPKLPDQINSQIKQQNEQKRKIDQQPAEIEESKSSINDDVSLQQEIDKKKLKALLHTDPPSELSVVAGNPYVWEFKIQNNGSVSWPSNTYFKCLAGPHLNMTQLVGAIQPNATVAIKLPMEAPEKQDKYPEVWGLVHENATDKSVFNFGPKVRYTLIVKPQLAYENNPFPNKSFVNIEQKQQPASVHQSAPINKPSISINDTLNESQIKNKYLTVATQMAQVLGGDVKKYVEFLKNISGDKVPTIENSINMYLENMKF